MCPDCERPMRGEQIMPGGVCGVCYAEKITAEMHARVQATLARMTSEEES